MYNAIYMYLQSVALTRKSWWVWLNRGRRAMNTNTWSGSCRQQGREGQKEKKTGQKITK